MRRRGWGTSTVHSSKSLRRRWVGGEGGVPSYNVQIHRGEATTVRKSDSLGKAGMGGWGGGG